MFYFILPLNLCSHFLRIVCKPRANKPLLQSVFYISSAVSMRAVFVRYMTRDCKGLLVWFYPGLLPLPNSDSKFRRWGAALRAVPSRRVRCTKRSWLFLLCFGQISWVQNRRKSQRLTDWTQWAWIGFDFCCMDLRFIDLCFKPIIYGH